LRHVFFRAFEQFKEAINDEDFEDLLKDAQADLKGGCGGAGLAQEGAAVPQHFG